MSFEKFLFGTSLLSVCATSYYSPPLKLSSNLSPVVALALATIAVYKACQVEKYKSSPHIYKKNILEATTLFFLSTIINILRIKKII